MRARSRCGGGRGGFRSTLGSGRLTPLPINGSVLGLTKKEPERWAARSTGAEGNAGRLPARRALQVGEENREPNRRQEY